MAERIEKAMQSVRLELVSAFAGPPDTMPKQEATNGVRSNSTVLCARRLDGSPDHAITSRPFLRTSAKSLSDAPAGDFSPRSHWLTSPVETLR